MEALVVVAFGRHDLDRIGDQFIEGIVGEIGRIGTRARRIAALVGGDGAIARRRERWQRRAPAMPRFGKPVQQQHERPLGGARDIRGECQARPRLYAGGIEGHRSVRSRRWP